jgi:hypothetical protein
MNIYLSSQEKHFDRLLEKLMRESVMRYQKESLKEQITTIRIHTPRSIADLDLSFFFNYTIFPTSILIAKAQWEVENRLIRVGDTILQQVFLPPFKTFSQKVIFGVRVNRIINETQRRGFSYETLEGHVERGESTFVIEQDHDQIIFKILTYSQPANAFIKTFASWAALPYQRYCTRMALENVRRQIQGQTHGPN